MPSLSAPPSTDIATPGLKIAIVHHWFRTYTGAERVVSALLEVFPQADLYALIATDEVAAQFAPKKITTSFLQNVPFSRRYHRHFLPLYPLALEQFDFRNYDVVISHESGPAKGIITPANVLHICYCHSPMRYIWDMYHEYVAGKDMSGLSRIFFRVVAHYIRLWDLATASRVDKFIASSHNSANRIQKIYRRDSTVLHPPVRVEGGYITTKIEDYYLIVGRLVDYKRADVAIEACRRLDRPLRVIGTGPQYERLRNLAGPGTTFLASLSDGEIKEQYAHCRALLFPSHEDFGLVPVEAHSFGRPVIAYGKGGALETIEGPFVNEGTVDSSCNGVLFREQTAESLMEAIQIFEECESRFSPTIIASSAQKFSVDRFKNAMAKAVAEAYLDFQQMDSKRLISSQ